MGNKGGCVPGKGWKRIRFGKDLGKPEDKPAINAMSTGHQIEAAIRDAGDPRLLPKPVKKLADFSEEEIAALEKQMGFKVKRKP